MTIPLPYLDAVTFCVREPNGSWTVGRAGDTVDISDWAERSRFPTLRMHPIPGQERLIYLHVQQATKASIPIFLEEAVHWAWKERLDLLAFGGVAGALFLLMLISFAQGIAFHDREFLKLAGFCALMTLGVAT